MSRVFILQKDLPNFKAGTKFIRDSVGDLYCSEINDKDGYPDSWTHRLVENNPEWFLEEQSPMQKALEEFVTDYKNMVVMSAEQIFEAAWAKAQKHFTEK